MLIEYETIKERAVTPCPNLPDRLVGSLKCSSCEHNKNTYDDHVVCDYSGDIEVKMTEATLEVLENSLPMIKLSSEIIDMLHDKYGDITFKQLKVVFDSILKSRKE